MTYVSTWVVLDIETTGLDPQKDLILELAAVHVSPRDLEVQAMQTWLCHHPAPVVEMRLNPFMRKMHTENKLLADLYASDTPPRAWTSEQAYYELDEQLVTFLQETGAPERSVMLAGNSVHFDRGFVTAHLPRSTKYLHHRHIDASGLREMYHAWVTEPPVTPRAHRALEDCMMSLSTLRWFARDILMNPSVKK